MDAAPYYAPTYFSTSYFYGAPASAPPSLVPTPYNAPTYFPPAYFYAPTTTVASPAGITPYNSPTYFPPAYFYGPADVPATGTGTSAVSTPYNAPAYFPPAYFYGSSTASVVVPVPSPIPDPVPSPTPDPAPVPDPSPTPVPTPLPVPRPCDQEHEAYSVMLAMIEGTGAFEEVIFGASTRRSQAGADTYPLAILTPQGWEESDDFDPTSIVRRVTFSITVVVKGQDDVPEYDQLDRLSAAIKKAVDRSDLGGVCLPALTRIRSGHFEYSGHYPEQILGLDGEFSTIIDPTADVPAST